MKKASLQEFLRDSMPSAHSTSRHFRKDWDEIASLVTSENPVCGGFNYDLSFREYLNIYTRTLNAKPVRERIQKWYNRRPEAGEELEINLKWKFKIGFEKRNGSEAPRKCYVARIILVSTLGDNKFYFPFECKSFFPVAEEDASYCYWGEKSSPELLKVLDK